MVPTILVVGATGNTGKAVVETLPGLLKQSKTLSGHRILALTRSASSSTAQAFAKLPGVEVEEISWPEIDEAWLRERQVDRAFIACHAEPTQFAEESTFLREALQAGVQYVVRISTTGVNVAAASRAYYARAHWAIEEMLSAPEYEKLHWSSLQPTAFTHFVLYSAAALIQEYRKTGKVLPLKLVASADVKSAPVHSDDVGILAAHLLARDDTTKYNRSKLVINGPEDITGEQIVALVEKKIGTKVQDVTFKDESFVEAMAAHSPYSKNVIRSIRYSLIPSWEGQTPASATSQAVLDLAPPKCTPAEVLDGLLSQ